MRVLQMPVVHGLAFHAGVLEIRERRAGADVGESWRSRAVAHVTGQGVARLRAAVWVLYLARGRVALLLQDVPPVLRPCVLEPHLLGQNVKT